MKRQWVKASLDIPRSFLPWIERSPHSSNVIKRDARRKFLQAQLNRGSAAQISNFTNLKTLKKYKAKQISQNRFSQIEKFHLHSNDVYKLRDKK